MTSKIEIEHNVPVVMRDGVVLRADVYRPVDALPAPVLLQRTPYFKSAGAITTMPDLYEAAARGYIVVHQDVRGRADSDGEWLPWANELEDGYDTIVWASHLEGSNGRVGMVGGSYTGNTQWSAAVSQPPGLISIAPMVTWSDPEDGLLFRGGAAELGVNSAWGLQTALGQIPKTSASNEQWLGVMGRSIDAFDHLADRTYWELPSGTQPSVQGTGQPDLGLARALANPSTLNETRVAGKYDRVRVPSLSLAGWFDIFQQGAIDNYMAMRERGIPAHLVVGPWSHTSVSGFFGGQTGETNFGLAAIMPAGRVSMSHLILDWHDHWLKGLPPTGLHKHGVDIFVMGVNQWRREEEWPLARRQETPFYLHPGGLASTDEPKDAESVSHFVYDPAQPVPTRGGAFVMSSDFVAGPADQRTVETREDVLVFTTEPLTSDVEITGRVRARLFVASDAPTSDWVVRVCEVDEVGRSMNIVDGIRRTQAEPGEIHEVEVDLWSTSIVIKAGHSLRVQVTASNFPRWDRNLNTTTPVTSAVQAQVARQSLHHGHRQPSSVILPIVPNAAKSDGIPSSV